MKSYALDRKERAQTGFTDLFVLEPGDIPDNATSMVTLTPTAPGDVLFRSRMLMEVRSFIVGPATCTVSVGQSSNVTLFIGASDVKSGGNRYLTDALAVARPYASVQTLVANIIAGSGACTAGEILIWLSISRAHNRA